ncbi:MAG: glycogen/starch/alpha-glucan phosphorylase [Gammaproteobacteria bacterium]|nr:glycogen/starch/alpha-glucan phosphorylase [Gammaproteobacteria bacterium]
MPPEDPRTNLPQPLLVDMADLGMDAACLAADIRRHFNHTLGCDKHSISAHHVYHAVVITLRDRLMERWKNTHYSYQQTRCKRAYYLSMEWLMGRSLPNAMLNLGVTEATAEALQILDLNLDDIIDYERDAGLGNGGLGRLAACFVDSCATLQLPVMGHGIRYEYGIFRQLIKNGYQVEEPDHWLVHGNPWELERPEFKQRVKFGGRVEYTQNRSEGLRVRWIETEDVLAIPYDLPVPGYENGTVNTVRLWKAVPTEEFDLGKFSAGLYPEAVAEKTNAENITKVLYPDDATEQGKVLRLRQQYFLTSAALQDVIRRWVRDYGTDFSTFDRHSCFQLNDTHPSIAIAELMRLLMDQCGLGWDEAWRITGGCMAYTNHTLLPEALEKWPVWVIREMLPRILDIIYEINARFLSNVARRWPGDTHRQSRMSIVEEGVQPHIRMAHLAIVGSFSVNGVAALHTRLLKEGIFRDFYEFWPERFNNKTNGVTPRRFLVQCNQGLSNLITEQLGLGWATDLQQLRQIQSCVDDPRFRQRWLAVKRSNKERLAAMVEKQCGVRFNPEALFDVQVKRIHEYKRQTLNILHVIHLYDRIKRGDIDGWTPRCVLLAGKAAPGYWMAKRIIKLIGNVANVINNDVDVGDLLKVAFLPDYSVSAMEVIAPGTDLSEQISTAGTEASGTGNMKFMFNGAITIGTLDGANIEIRNEVGEENFFLFGVNSEQLGKVRSAYNPLQLIAGDEDLRRVFALLESGHFNQFEPGHFNAIIDSVKSPGDPWLVAADFRSFVDAQKRVAAAYQDRDRWARLSIANTANCGFFSSDRTIRAYNDEIWKLKSVPPLTAK